MYSHRGFMLDTARRFFPPESIMCLLDWLGEAGFNVFHWHLTDAQSFPLAWDHDGGRLADLGCFHDPTGRPTRYTQEEVTDIRRHAAQQGLVVLPEFDFPAHCEVIGRSYPGFVSGPAGSIPPECELNLSGPEAWNFVAHLLLDMMLEWFPDSPCIHLGGDEVVGHWPDKDPRATQFRFHDTFERHLVLACGRRPLIWNDPVTDKKLPLSLDFTVQCWHDDPCLEAVLELGYSAIAAASPTWYIGNATPQGLRSAFLPEHSNLQGAELVWFTSPHDDTSDLEWLRPLIEAAGKRLSQP